MSHGRRQFLCKLRIKVAMFLRHCNQVILYIFQEHFSNFFLLINSDWVKAHCL